MGTRDLVSIDHMRGNMWCVLINQYVQIRGVEPTFFDDHSLGEKTFSKV